MRHYFILVFIFISFSDLNAQRFHQSLKSILSEPHEQKIPPHFQYFHLWFQNSTDGIYFTDFQFSEGSKGSAKFIKLGLIFNNQKEVKWGDSGLKLEFKDSVNGKPIPIYLIINEILPLVAYHPNFEANDYNPNDYSKKMEYGARIESLSEPQILANVINVFGVSEPNKSALMYIVDDISRRSKLKLKVDENEPKPLDSILNQIYGHTNNYPHQFLYDLYIKNSNSKKQHQNLNTFFRSFTSVNIAERIDDYASLKVEFQVEKEKVFLKIPSQFIDILNEESSTNLKKEISLNIGEAQLKVVQGFEIAPHIELFFNYVYPMKDSNLFQIPNEIKLNPSFISDKNRTLRTFDTKDIKEVKLKMYEKETVIFLNISQEEIKIGSFPNR